MKKILHMQLLPILSGAQRVSLNEIEHQKHKFNYTLLCASHGDLTDKLQKLGVNSIIDKNLVRKLSLKHDLKALLSVYKFLKINRFDVIHTHSSKPGIIGRFAARLAGITNIIHTAHGFAFPYAKNKISYFIYFCMEYLAKYATDHLIVLHKADYDIAVKKLKYPTNKVSIIPNGIDINFFTPSQHKYAKFTFVMIARLSEPKDPMTVLHAINYVKNKMDANFLFIGDGEYKAKIVKYIKDNNLNEHVKLLGWQNDVKPFLQQAHCFVLSSKWEAMPLAILEAMSCKLPVIASNVIGNNTLVEQNKTGLLFNAEDHVALASAMEKIFNDKFLYNTLAINGFEQVINHYSLSIRNEKVNKLYMKSP